MFGVRLSSYGCTRKVVRAREKRLSIVDRASWLGSSTNFKATLFYVEQTVTLHTVLFNVLAQMLLLVSC